MREEQILFRRFVSFTFIAVAADHRIRFIHKPLAGSDACPQLLLVLLQFTSLSLAPLRAPLFIGNVQYLRLPNVGRSLFDPCCRPTLLFPREPIGFAMAGGSCYTCCIT